VTELVGAAVRAVSSHVTEGSRRNARTALEARHAVDRHGAEVLAGLAAGSRRTPAPDRILEQHLSA
jgi:hypothetical protein